jgi:hypothetical protein
VAPITHTAAGSDDITIVMPYFAGGDLAVILAGQHGAPFPEATLGDILLQV